jgi:hypothetical protein
MRDEGLKYFEPTASFYLENVNVLGRFINRFNVVEDAASNLGVSTTNRPTRGMISQGTIRVQPLKSTQQGADQVLNKSVSKILRYLSAKFGVPITSKRFNKRKYDAVYELHPEAIVSKWDNDLQPISHELGHHLDKKYSFSDDYLKLLREINKVQSILNLNKNRPNVDMSKYQAELNKLLKQKADSPIAEMVKNLPIEFHDAYENYELPGEAIAEFVKRYLVNQIEADYFGNGFYDIFESKLSKDELSWLAQARTDIGHFYGLSEMDKVGTTMQSHADPVEQDLQQKVDKFRTEQIDDIHMLGRYDKAVENVTGKKLSADRQTYKLGYSHVMLMLSQNRF